MTPAHFPSNARRLALVPLAEADRVAEVERRLTEAIGLGLFRDGEQLPSEAELAAQLNVSTVTLREALAALRRSGLVTTRRGRKGGTFVHAPAEEADARLLERLSSTSIDELRDFADRHAAVAAYGAKLAVQRASLHDIARLEDHLSRLASASTLTELRAADARFHVELTASSRSLSLTEAETEANADMGPLVWLALGTEGAAEAVDAHRGIVSALRARDAELAQRVVCEHVTSQMAAVIGLRLRTAAEGLKPVDPEECAKETLRAVGAKIDGVIDGLAAMRDVALTLAGEADAAGRQLRRSDLPPLQALAKERLVRPSLICGTGMVFAPGVLADATRWLEWWRFNDGRDPVLLEACLTPGDPSFYDYEGAEWFVMPRNTGQPWVAGPFIDHSGTNEHIITVSVPVLHRGAFIGIVGADVSVRQLATVAEELLIRAAGQAVLVTKRGRIVASNDPSRLVGTLWDSNAPVNGEPGDLAVTAGQRVVTDAKLGWSVVIDAPTPSATRRRGRRRVAR